MGPKRIVVLNAGSSSLKAALIGMPDTRLGHAEVSWVADPSGSGERVARLRSALEELSIGRGEVTSAIEAVAYRVVHGGLRFTGPTRIDDAVIRGIEAVADLAPLHNAVALEAIAAGREALPNVPHVACFDTAFHATLAPEAYRYPVPERWYREWGIRRFGFHGLSVAWSVRRAGELLGRSPLDLCLVVAHLGSGCSVTAVHGGRSVETSMGLTPLEGLMMATRSGSIDPGLPFHLIDRGRLDAHAVVHALDHESGLLGVSGTTSDMRRLLEAAGTGDEAAALAVAMFVRKAAAWIASVATTLPRIDAIVFTGGIGEHAGEVRERIVARLAVLGIRPLPSTTSEADGDVRLDAEDTGIPVLRVEAREDLIIAREAVDLLAGLP